MAKLSCSMRVPGFVPLGSLWKKNSSRSRLSSHCDHACSLGPYPGVTLSQAYEKKNEIDVRGYDGVDMSFGKIMAEPMKAPFFPIAMRGAFGDDRY